MTSVLSCQVSMRGNLVRPVPLSAKSACMQLGPPPFPQVQFFTSSSTHLVTPALQYFRFICTLRGLLSPFSIKCHTATVDFSFRNLVRGNCHANLKFGLEVHDKIGYIFPKDRARVAVCKFTTSDSNVGASCSIHGKHPTLHRKIQGV